MGKRYASLDFIRGVAMLGVLLFHVTNVGYANTIDSVKQAIKQDLSLVPAGMIVLALILMYFGMFNGLFMDGHVKWYAARDFWSNRGTSSSNPGMYYRPHL